MTRVALLGFGTVGSAVARRLTAHPAPPGLVLTHIFDRSAELKRAQLATDVPVIWTSRIADVLDSDVDIVVETIGGIEPAADWIHAALTAGKSVVTANKQVVARRGVAFWNLAARHGRQFRFEAAVGGAMPIVGAIADGLSGDVVTTITAILNGTTNAVLSRMESTGCSLSDALSDARERGYAERDPRADLDGHDAAAKLAILCALAFGLRVDPDAIPILSAADVTSADLAAAKRRGGTIRQLATAEYDVERCKLTASVAPAFVPADSIFGRAVGPQNAAAIRGKYSGEIGLSGAGAGGDATAVSIIGDLKTIARDRSAIVSPIVVTSNFELATSNLQNPALAEAV